MGPTIAKKKLLCVWSMATGMGFLGTTVVIVGAWSISMNMMKRTGVITVHPKKISNPNARKAFELTMWLGDQVLVRADTLIKQSAEYS